MDKHTSNFNFLFKGFAISILRILNFAFTNQNTSCSDPFFVKNSWRVLYILGRQQKSICISIIKSHSMDPRNPRKRREGMRYTSRSSLSLNLRLLGYWCTPLDLYIGLINQYPFHLNKRPKALYNPLSQYPFKFLAQKTLSPLSF